jgi:SWIM zinc finger
MALAPDASGLNAARKLALPEPWSDTGCDDRAVWGTCRGSARHPYQVMCDTSGPAYRCTCPSQKVPCKHALGLLLLWAQNAAGVPAGEPPAEVAAWLAGRAEAGRNGSISSAVEGRHPPLEEQVLTGTRPRTADPEAAARRAAQRIRRIAAGMAELDRWLGDLVRRGFGHAQAQPYGFWDAVGARLVDAQAPAAAARVRSLAGVVRSGEGWPGRLLAEVARLHLLAAGWARYQSLPRSNQADLRSAVGWPWPSEQVLAGPREPDRWYVLARRVTDEEQLRAQRTWLWGLDRRRLAVLVDFARPGAAFAWELWPGTVLDADLVRFPGSAPLRVLVAERRGEPVPGGTPPGWRHLGDLAEARSATIACDPWIDRWPVSVRAVIPRRLKTGWQIVDEDGRRLPLSVDEDAGWRLYAASGGRPVHLLGEWEGPGVVPLGAWMEDRMVSI